MAKRKPQEITSKSMVVSMSRFQHFDTHKAIKTLTQTGMDESQAEKVVSTIIEARDSDLSHLITKEMFLETKEMLLESGREMKAMFLEANHKTDAEFVAVRQEIKDESAALRKEIRDEAATIRQEFKNELTDFRKEMREEMTTKVELHKMESNIVKWMIGGFIALASLTLSMLLKGKF